MRNEFRQKAIRVVAVSSCAAGFLKALLELKCNLKNDVNSEIKEQGSFILEALQESINAHINLINERGLSGEEWITSDDVLAEINRIEKEAGLNVKETN